MNLGNQLKNYRQENKLTQKQLADRLFVSDKTISKWEVEKGYPDLATLPRIASLLDTTVDDLLAEKTTPKYHEYKSQRQFLGQPLLHIVLPPLLRRYFSGNLFYQRESLFKKSIPQAKGIIAIGVCAKGIISIGLLAQGVISLGLLSVGILSGGVASLGMLALGDLALGITTIANIGIGLYVIANVALGVVTSGNLAVGWSAIANQGYGTHSYSLGDNFTWTMYKEAVEKLQEEISQPIVMNFYNFTLWFENHPWLVIFLVIFLFLGIGACLGLIFSKRHELFKHPIA